MLLFNPSGGDYPIYNRGNLKLSVSKLVATWSQGYWFAAGVPEAGPASSLGPGEQDFLQ